MSDGTGAGDGAFIKQRRMSWAALIMKVYEVDLLPHDAGGNQIVMSRVSSGNNQSVSESKGLEMMGRI